MPFRLPVSGSEGIGYEIAACIGPTRHLGQTHLAGDHIALIELVEARMGVGIQKTKALRQKMLGTRPFVKKYREQTRLNFVEKMWP
ncbi:MULTISPECIES: hypothetical protein [unclassified Ensifer]|uniref:hypothetical protein n=1 Tax=unclassified Ensifer TaxID=2633371 RepID=UPI000813ADA6|nr:MULTISPECIES: hypothetical protein [unclassified Ensifer]OCP18780.1 hypothetical protein BC361_31380 [Ensifer sp. LC54]OCP25934.1 hypothetical protein BC363_19415 [Ensifer sp. LC384]OCP36227.1 hypothetical protein BC360_25285 [Ensifer sp. LC163]